MRIKDRDSATQATRAYGRTAATRESDRSGAAARLDRPVADTFVHGIPEGDLTPPVLAAIERLLGEVRQLHEEIESLRDRLSRAETLADLDPLVPLRNRRSFVRELERMLAYAERRDQPMSLLLADVDGLKPINDQGGHATGDEAIREVAAALLEVTRSSDLVGRLGGDEFGIVLMDMDEDDADMIADRITQAVSARSVWLPDGPVALSVSCGVCTFHAGLSLADALATADANMYRAKADRRRS